MYTAGMWQSLLSRVGAKGIAAVTGTTFSFRTREIQPPPPPPPKMISSLLQDSQNVNHLFNLKETAARGEVKERFGCFFFFFFLV